MCLWIARVLCIWSVQLVLGVCAVCRSANEAVWMSPCVCYVCISLCANEMLRFLSFLRRNQGTISDKSWSPCVFFGRRRSVNWLLFSRRSWVSEFVRIVIEKTEITTVVGEFFVPLHRSKSRTLFGFGLNVFDLCFEIKSKFNRVKIKKINAQQTSLSLREKFPGKEVLSLKRRWKKTPAEKKNSDHSFELKKVNGNQAVDLGDLKTI